MHVEEEEEERRGMTMVIEAKPKMEKNVTTTKMSCDVENDADDNVDDDFQIESRLCSW